MTECRKRNNPRLMFDKQRALQAEPQSYDDLCHISGLNKPAVARWIKSLRPDTGERHVHIADYGPDRNGRLFVPLFAWGNEEDAERPGDSRTDAERMRKLRADRKLGLR